MTTSHYALAISKLKKTEKGIETALSTDINGDKATEEMILAIGNMGIALVHSMLAIAEAISEAK
jgi:hypothetical protein